MSCSVNRNPEKMEEEMTWMVECERRTCFWTMDGYSYDTPELRTRDANISMFTTFQNDQVIQANIHVVSLQGYCKAVYCGLSGLQLNFNITFLVSYRRLLFASRNRAQLYWRAAVVKTPIQHQEMELWSLMLSMSDQLPKSYPDIFRCWLQESATYLWWRLCANQGQPTFDKLS